MMDLSRRKFLTAAGAAGIGAAVAIPTTLFAKEIFAPPQSVSFFGRHQNGIIDRMQERLYLAVLDVETESAAELETVLRKLTSAASRMSHGLDAGPIGATSGSPESPPDDTGEALNLTPAGLTFTIGFGASIFDSRFGFAKNKPENFQALPIFARDQVLPEKLGGDLMIQVCSDDDQVAFHAIRNLIRIGKGALVVKSLQSGFSGHNTGNSTETPRNLFGFKDGTANLNTQNEAELNEHLWVDKGWMAGGTYAAVRTFRFKVETWDRSSLLEQEQVFGRTKQEGAPLSGGTEFSTADFTSSKIPNDSHIALAHHSRHGGAKILRRAFNYTNGADVLGNLDAGLIFMSFQKDLEKQFVPIQNALANNDRMNEYVAVTASAAFACPPGLKAGQFWGHQLFS